MFYIIFFGVFGVLLAWLAMTYWPVLVAALVIGIGYGVYSYSFTDGGALLDKAYYCNVLGTDTSTQEWNNVVEWTSFDERHIDSSAEDYWRAFRSSDCKSASAAALDNPGKYRNIDYKHSKLGYIRRYYFLRNGIVVPIYRDTKQFLWQRALMLRIDENCTLNRDTNFCTPVPSAENCGWSSAFGSYEDCSYDIDGRGTLHPIRRDNFIFAENW